MKVEGIGIVSAKEWSWSYSKLKNYETCPKRHYEIDLAKTYAEEQVPGGPLDYGNKAHGALAKACSGAEALPEPFREFQTWVDRVRAGPGELLVEQKYAITRDFRATKYFAKDVWYRGIGDVVRLYLDVALILDWKTGKILEDTVQLMLMAQCIFSHYPQVKRVRSEYVWLKDECTTPEVFDKQEIADQWVSLLPRVAALEAASKSLIFPPKASGLCKRHCVVASCPFWRKGPRG